MPLVMEKKPDGSYQSKDGNLLEWTTGIITKPCTVQPMGGGQALAFGAVTMTAGVVLGATVMAKQGKKLAAKMKMDKLLKVDADADAIATA